MEKMSLYGVFGQGVQLPIAKPSARLKSPHAVGFGMGFTLRPAQKNNAAAMAKKILPTIGRFLNKVWNFRQATYDGCWIGLPDLLRSKR